MIMDRNVIRQALAFWNDWWYRKGVPESIPRNEYLSDLIPLLDMREVIVLMGIRRSGIRLVLHRN